MALWFAALLGLVQGLTEFLPVSSTAHLRIVPALLGQPDAGAAYTAVIQLGTLLAVVVYFARDLFVTMPRALIRAPGSPEGRLAIYLVIGSIPIVVGGLALHHVLEDPSGPLRSLYTIAAALVVVGVAMAVIERRAWGRRALAEVGLRDAVLIGCAQAMALVPGVSRSGATISVALLCGLARPDAARFSFLLGIPAIAGAGLFEVKDALHVLGHGAWPALAVGTGVAAVTGYVSIAWLLRYLSSRTLTPFAIYRVLLGAALVSLIMSHTVAP